MKTNYTFLITALLSLFSFGNIFSQGIPARQEIRIDQVYQQYNLNGEGVVVAIIDRGIDYTHTDFIDENGKTRLLYIYDMINPSGANDPNNPYGVGTIFTENEINTSLETDGPPLSTDRYGHGTATSGISAGNGSGTTSQDFHGVAPKAKLIIVKAIQDYFPAFDGQPAQEGFYNPSYIPIALQFVADKLEEAGMPGVALLNMGSIGGPTDGTSNISRAMNDFVDLGYPLVCGVGDDGGADNHAYATIGLNESIELEIQKDVAGNLRFDLWYSEDDRFEVSITRPDNSTEGPYTAPETANGADDRFLTGINYYHRGANQDFAGATSNRREIMIDISGPTGIYKIGLKATTVGASGDFHATLNPSTHGNTNKFLNHIVEGYSLNDFTTAEKVISPTDYVVKNDWIDMDGIQRQMVDQGDPGELWVGSSWGPSQTGAMTVDFAACGEVLYGAYSPNTWYSHFPHLLIQDGNNHYGIQNAVSAAAPLTTGVIALILEANSNLEPATVKQILQQTARSDSYTGTLPNNQWGYGKLDAFAAVEEAKATGIFNVQNTQKNIVIFPNPAKDYTNISFKDNTSEPIEQISIVNHLGQTVAIYKENNTRLDISNLPAGIYYLMIETEAGMSSGKFLKF